jgi:hypothetical protein
MVIKDESVHKTSSKRTGSLKKIRRRDIRSMFGTEERPRKDKARCGHLQTREASPESNPDGLGLGLQASRTMRKYISVVQTTWSLGFSYGSAGTLIQCPCNAMYTAHQFMFVTEQKTELHQHRLITDRNVNVNYWFLSIASELWKY